VVAELLDPVDRRDLVAAHQVIGMMFSNSASSTMNFRPGAAARGP